jgi:hypothetical protein
MAQYQVLRDCYGFQGRYWEKGMIVDIDPKDNPPHHFKRVDGKESGPEPAKTTTGPGVTIGYAAASTVAHQELILEAKSRGIKDAEILNQDELLEVLAKDISRQKITAIILKAKTRQQKK